MTNTKNTAGQITTFGNGSDLNGLDDGTDKIHSGILKALFAVATGNYLHSISTNGVTQSEVGGFTRFTTDNPMTFYRNGERYQITGSDLTVDYEATHDADGSTDRYDFLVINSSNTLSIRKGTVTGSDTNVAVLSDGDVPICLIKCVAGSTRTVITRPLQFYTAADSDRAIFMTASSGHGIIENVGEDKDILFKGIDSASAITALTLDMSEEGKAIFNAGAEFKKDVTIYEDANNADVSLSLGTGSGEALTISVLNGSSNKTAEEVHFSTATASATANHGKMVFDVDGTDIATIDDGGIDLASGKTFSINGTDLTSGTITALNNQTADRLVTIGATTTELDGEANLTFDGTDLKLLKDANNADVSLTLGTSDAESLKIQVLNGGSNKTAEEVHFSTATASGSADAGKMIFDIDGTDKLLIDDAGIDVTGAMTASTTIQATTSVTSAAIVGTNTVTGGEVTGTTFVKTDGLEFIGLEIMLNGVLPVPSFSKSIIYINDISAASHAGGPPVANQISLPLASSAETVRLTFKNIQDGGTAGSQQPITIIPQGSDVIDFGQTDHPYVTSANVITIAMGQSVTIQAITDSGGAPIQTGWYVIGM